MLHGGVTVRLFVTLQCARQRPVPAHRAELYLKRFMAVHASWLPHLRVVLAVRFDWLPGKHLLHPIGSVWAEPTRRRSTR
jgi:hypothetical protein